MNGDQWLNQAEFSVSCQLALLMLVLTQMLLAHACWSPCAANAVLVVQRTGHCCSSKLAAGLTCETTISIFPRTATVQHAVP